MIISNIKQISDGNVRELSATVRFETTGKDERYFIRVPDTGSPIPNPADSFMVGLVLQSMALGERIRIDSPVSGDIFNNLLTKTLPLLRSWFPRLHPARPEAERTEPLPALNGKSAVLFSGGVDSWHAFLSEQDQINSLVHIHGFEMLVENGAIWDAAHKSVQSVAKTFGKQVIPVTSNFREANLKHVGRNPDLNWRRFGTEVGYGHLLCAITLALRQSVRRIFVPSSYSENATRVGSHHLIEPELSTPSMQYVFQGKELNRVQKLERNQSLYPEFVNNLRVCTNYGFSPVEGTVNCGRCIKCLRTGLELRVCGIRTPEKLFHEQPDARRLFSENVGGNRELWELLAHEAHQRKVADVHAAVNDMLNPNNPARRFRRLKRRIRQRFGAQL